MADRLMEAKARAVNHHAFDMILSAHATKLASEHDLLPLTHGARTDMLEGVVVADSRGTPDCQSSSLDAKDSSLATHTKASTRASAAEAASPRIAASSAAPVHGARSLFYSDCAPSAGGPAWACAHDGAALPVAPARFAARTRSSRSTGDCELCVAVWTALD